MSLWIGYNSISKKFTITPPQKSSPQSPSHPSKRTNLLFDPRSIFKPPTWKMLLFSTKFWEKRFSHDSTLSGSLSVDAVSFSRVSQQRRGTVMRLWAMWWDTWSICGEWRTSRRREGVKGRGLSTEDWSWRECCWCWDGGSEKDWKGFYGDGRWGWHL